MKRRKNEMREWNEKKRNKNKNGANNRPKGRKKYKVT
jgi:hypothetical protein